MKDLLTFFFLIYKNNPTKQKDIGNWSVATGELSWLKKTLEHNNRLLPAAYWIHYLMIFLFQLIFAEWVQFSCPHCTTISWIHLYILFGWVSVVRRWGNSVHSNFHSSSNLTNLQYFNFASQSLPYLLIKHKVTWISCWVLKSGYSSKPHSVMICTVLR